MVPAHTSGKETAITYCQRCGTEASPTQRVRACTRCFTVGYCSKDCQKRDWKDHKPNCKNISSPHAPRSTSEDNGVVRLQVKRGDADEWEDAGPINLMGDMSCVSIDDDSTRPSRSTPTKQPNLILTKELPKRTKQILGSESESSSMYQYNHSRDGVDENLLIFFHGAGDSHLPYDTLGKKMELPQTATLSLSAALSLNNLSNESPTAARKNSSKFVELPFGLGYTWFEEMDYSTGETLSKDHSRRVKSLEHAVEILDPLICSLIGMSNNEIEETWIPERIFLFGFSAGACLSMELCRRWMNAGRMPLGGAICIAGGIQTKDQLSGTKQRDGTNTTQNQATDVLVIAGDRDQTYTKQDSELSKQLYDPSKVQIHIQKGKDHAMIQSKEEMQVVMEFLSKRLVRRMVSMEGQSR